MPQTVLDHATGTSHDFPDEATPAEIEQAMGGFGKKTMAQHFEEGTKRVASDFGSAITGVLKAGQNIAGTPGDVDQYLKGLGAPPIFGGGGAATSERIGDFFSKLGGGPETHLVPPSTPEGKIIEPVAQGVASMASGNPLVAGIGGASGLAGELASRFMDTEAGGDKSGWRTGGQLAITAPFALASAFKPGNVRAMQPVLKLLGESKADILNAIDRAAWRGGTAADAIKTPVPNTWAQMPEIHPEIKALRGTLAGEPLNKQAAVDAADYARLAAGGGVAKVKPQWDNAQGWSDPQEALTNMIEGGVNTAAQRIPTLFSDLKNNVVGKVVGLINPLDWPKKGGEAIAGAVAQGNVTALAKALASKDAPAALKEIVNYSPGMGMAKMLAKTLIRLQGMTGPSTTGGNQPASGVQPE